MCLIKRKKNALKRLADDCITQKLQCIFSSFTIGNVKYSVNFEEASSRSVTITVKSAGEKVFESKIIWGKYIDKEWEQTDKDVIYITKFQRLSIEYCGVGKETAKLITKLAEYYRFDIIGVNPVASSAPDNNYLNQTSLEKFYKQYLGGNITKYEVIEDSNRVNTCLD